ncbi:MAG: HNH endonuclease [Lautropia sp.]
MAKIPSWRTDKRTTAERGYGTAWQKARLLFLQEHPLCEACQQLRPPRIVPATVVDHRIPHRGDQTLFWDESLWTPLCATHHSSDKQMIEKSGRKRLTFDAAGNVNWPEDRK